MRGKVDKGVSEGVNEAKNGGWRRVQGRRDRVHLRRALQVASFPGHSYVQCRYKILTT